MANEEALLNFEGNFDVNAFDGLVRAMYSGTDPKSIALLSKFKEHPDSWRRADAILEHSKMPESKFIALQILEALVKYRWNILPADQKSGIKTYVVDFIIKLSSTSESLEREKLILGKLNVVLVQIVKHEWPKNWESFIPDLVSSSRNSESLCENNMAILQLLSEEIFEFSLGEMTSRKTKKMKSDWISEFHQVFQLCVDVLSQSQRPSLLHATLRTLHRFLTWIPLGYIWETPIIDLLTQKFFPYPFFRNVSLKCLTEIGALTSADVPAEMFVKFFMMFMEQLSKVFGRDTNIVAAYEKGSNDDRDFILNLAMMLTSFLHNHLSKVEIVQRQATLEVHHYLSAITLVNNNEVFKVCLEYWNKLADSLYHEPPAETFPQSSLMLGGNRGNPQSPRGCFYAEIMSKVRVAVVSRMRKPKEVLIVEDENGELVRESLPDTANLEMYKQMRETLIFLTHLDPEDMQKIMIEKLKKQCKGDWTWKGLNTLCWAIGSISGSLLEEDEKNFVVTVIRELLTLCEKIRGKDNKAVIASNIMYIVGQYPRFLLAHWKFLKTVVNKLFEFMHETFPGVQDMACDTFLKISKQCKEKFVITHQGEVGFIEDILANLNLIIRDLDSSQIHSFYESVGYMISSASDPKQRENLIERLMEGPNAKWDQIISVARENIDFLRRYDNVKCILNIMKTNVRACQSLGFCFLPQLVRNFIQNLEVYRRYSQSIGDEIKSRGNQATYFKEIKAMRAVKKETLRLIETFVSKTNDVEMVAKEFVPPLMDAILVDYRTNIPQARDPEVLSVMACIVNKLRFTITPQIPLVFDNVFECTLQMITSNFEDFPDHRVKFFKLLRSINSHCFPAFLGMQEKSFSLIIDSIVWAFKHTMKDVAESGLLIMLELWKNVSNCNNAEFAGMFVRRFYVSILTDVLVVLTDRLHKSGFKLQSQILQAMITVVESGHVQVPLFDPSSQPSGMTNQLFLRNFLKNLLEEGFPILNGVQVEKFIVGLCDLNKDQNAFKNHLRDFLVQLKEFAGEEDLELLFAEEKEQEAQSAAENLRAKHAAIPGMIANTMEEES